MQMTELGGPLVYNWRAEGVGELALCIWRVLQSLLVIDMN